MFDWKSPTEWKRLVRYYQAGIVNAAFGYGLFALLVYLGLNIYLAQITSHIGGTAFNYLTYSRYAFAGTPGSKLAFMLSYVFNYALSVATLAALTQIGVSPYLAGLLAIVVTSLVNFFILKRFVFRSSGTQS